MLFTPLPAALSAARPVFPETSWQRPTGIGEQDSSTRALKPSTAETGRKRKPGSAGIPANQRSCTALRATNDSEGRENAGDGNRAGRGSAARMPIGHAPAGRNWRFVYIYRVLHDESFGELAAAQRILVATTTGHITGANRNVVRGNTRCTAFLYRSPHARGCHTDRGPGLYDTGRPD